MPRDAAFLGGQGPRVRACEREDKGLRARRVVCARPAARAAAVRLRVRAGLELRPSAHVGARCAPRGGVSVVRGGCWGGGEASEPLGLGGGRGAGTCSAGDGPSSGTPRPVQLGREAPPTLPALSRSAAGVEPRAAAPRRLGLRDYLFPHPVSAGGGAAGDT